MTNESKSPSSPRTGVPTSAQTAAHATAQAAVDRVIAARRGVHLGRLRPRDLMTEGRR